MPIGTMIIFLKFQNSYLQTNSVMLNLEHTSQKYVPSSMIIRNMKFQQFNRIPEYQFKQKDEIAMIISYYLSICPSINIKD